MKRLAALFLVVPLHACAAAVDPGVPVLLRPEEGCPVVLLERSGALGFERKGGVIAAVWKSGAIVRAESLDRPSGPHVVGQLAPEVLRELLDAASSGKTWSAPPGEVALDTEDDELILRRGSERRSWVESPGVTSNVVVQWFRARLTSLRIEQPRRTRAPLDRLRHCVDGTPGKPLH